MERVGDRKDYETPGIEVSDLAADPITQFRTWLDAAHEAGVLEPEAMTLSTAGPSARIVLVRGLDERGFAFYTSYSSAKAAEIAEDPRVALTFAWPPMHRQVRIEGRAERLPEEESDAYFAERPRGSQIGAWASPQSSVLPDRATLERRVAEAEARFEGAEVPRPPDWGGYLVRPQMVEFWQGRESRLHDRLRYRLVDQRWTLERLAP